MDTILFFIRTTVMGGITFFLPLMFIKVMLDKAVSELTRMVGPLAEKLGIATIAGQATILMLVILLIILICFFAGLLMRLPQFKKLNELMEDNLMTFVPGYDAYKKKMLSKVTRSKKKEESAPPERTLVLLFDQYAWVPALKTEMHNGFCSYFFPADSSLKSGYVKILPMDSVHEKVIPFEQLNNVMSPDGKGIIALIGETNL